MVQAAAERFRTEPRVLPRTLDGIGRISVEGEILLHTPHEAVPFQLERCCTQCGSSNPDRWPAKAVRTVAGGEVRVPEGHVCFWCRCYNFQSGGAPVRPMVVRRPAVARASRPVDVQDDRPWWLRLYGIPRWAELGPLRAG